jgi:hypothetical protein
MRNKLDTLGNIAFILFFVAAFGLLAGFIFGNLGLILMAALIGISVRLSEAPPIYKIGGFMTLILVSPIKFVLYGHLNRQSMLLTALLIISSFIFFDWVTKKLLPWIDNLKLKNLT